MEKQKSTGVRPQIISPIYGAGNDRSASASKSVVEPSAKHETVVAGARSVSMEDTIPEFSLDDILKARDEEVRMPEFPDLDFDDDEDDKTILIKRSDAE